MMRSTDHPTDDALVLFAYGEPGADDLTAHLGSCDACRARFTAIERARVAADWTLMAPAAPRRAARWAVFGALAAAAALAVLLLRPRPPVVPSLSLAVPRYVVPELSPLDSLLTRLEQEKPYALP